MEDSIATAQARIADTFNRYFANFDIRIEPGDVTLGSRREVGKRGWWIAYRVDPDDGGFPSLEFYAVHRMTNDSHVRIWADGQAEWLEAIQEAYGYDSKVPGAEDAAREKYFKHNRRIEEQLRAAGLLPELDINTYLRTGGNQTDLGTDQEGSR